MNPQFTARLLRSSPTGLLSVSVIIGQTIIELQEPADLSEHSTICLLLSPMVIALCLNCLKRGRFLVYLLLGLSLGASSMLPDRSARTLQHSLGQPVSALIRIESIPVSYTAHGLAFQATVESAWLQEGAKAPLRREYLPRKIQCNAPYLPWLNSQGVRTGDRLVALVTLKPIKSDEPFGSYQRHLWRTGIEAICEVHLSSLPIRSSATSLSTMVDSYRSHLIKVAHSATESRDIAGVLLSMTIGLRHVVSREVSDAFKATGLMHLLVVSGFQISVLAFGSLTVFRLVGASFYGCSFGRVIFALAPILTLLFVLLYVAVVGFDTAAVRAVLAFAFFSLALFCDRQRRFFNGFFFSLLMLAVLWPGCVFEPGVQLTYAALLGIGLGMPRRGEGVLYACLRMNLLISLCTAVPVLLWFNQISLVGVLLNPLAGPLVSFISCALGIPILMISSISPTFLGWLLWPVIQMVKLLTQLVSWLAAFEIVKLQLDPGPAKVLAGVAAAIIGALVIRHLRYLSRPFGETE